MAILELDKIIIKKPDTGIHCTNCGGDLKNTNKKKLLGWIITITTFGKVNSKHYQCEICKKKYLVI
jgi:hypothetical protein